MRDFDREGGKCKLGLDPRDKFREGTIWLANSSLLLHLGTRVDRFLAALQFMNLVPQKEGEKWPFLK